MELMDEITLLAQKLEQDCKDLREMSFALPLAVFEDKP